MDIGVYVFLRDFSTLFIGLLSPIIGSIYFYKYKDSVLKYFLAYLWISVILDYGAYIAREYFDIGNNGIVYNIFFFFSFIYLSSLYYRILRDPKKKKAVYAFIFVYIISFIVGGFYENYMTDFQSIPFITASILFVLQAALYFIEILNSKRILYIKKNLFFWISIGILVYYVGNIPFRIAIKYYLEKESTTILFSLLYVLIILTHICYMIGFIWSDKKQQY
ncbi:hypothetical protein [Aquimarina mytili]|uniref:Uncharacterized protein n=1 Tax=Aquimarina mytili TaxID=874423 RepID=A0A936ZXI1_9FLAO|nr:hypothetical protein [Aquimarina mytili]MBL0683745.1 hypothetical protein [Aquimarina mytili]